MRLLTIVLACTLAAPAIAQTQTRVFLGNTPADSDPKVGISSNTFPWSREQLRYQVLFPAAKFGGKPWFINDILAAPQLSMTPTRRTAIYQDIEIRIGQTAATSLSSSWSTNNPKPVTVHRGPLQFDMEVGKWRGMGMDKHFFYLPSTTAGNLCVEFIIWKMDTSTASIRAVTGSARRAYYYKWTTAQTTPASTGSSAAKMGLVMTSGNWVEAGSGCAGSAKNRPTLSSAMWPKIGGSPFVMDLSGGKPGSVGIMIFGTNRDKLGALNLPFDLAPAGAAGCLVWNDIFFTSGVGINATGTGKFSLSIPSTLSGYPRLYAHWWNLDSAANKFGLTTSNLGVMVMGR